MHPRLSHSTFRITFPHQRARTSERNTECADASPPNTAHRLLRGINVFQNYCFASFAEPREIESIEHGPLTVLLGNISTSALETWPQNIKILTARPCTHSLAKRSEHRFCHSGYEGTVEAPECCLIGHYCKFAHLRSWLSIACRKSRKPSPRPCVPYP